MPNSKQSTKADKMVMHPALNTSPATGGFAGTTADQIKDNKGKKEVLHKNVIIDVMTRPKL